MNRNERIKQLFSTLCDLDPAERVARLDNLANEDPDLAAELSGLLAADAEQDSFLLGIGGDEEGSLLTPAGSGVVRSPDDGSQPDSVAGYRILGLLGRGGMGVVYRAQQREPHRSVALKLLDSPRDPDLVRRFRQEGELLGRLEHPGIARVYEIGTDQSAPHEQPFIAMELIDGTDLISYVQEHHLDRTARLELFTQICDAVAHAHHRGVIHRDLKPQNILVSTDGIARILDFGVARLREKNADDPTMTSPGMILGTLPYMSPEQVRGAATDVDTRSDIYALGVILYRLLCGRMPHDLKGEDLIDAIRIIAERPPRPMHELSGGFARDLVVITEKALRKEPERRFSSAGELAADIRRHLNDEAILARPSSAGYVISKFARRHRAICASVAMLAITIIGALVVTIHLYRDANHQRQRAEDRGRIASENLDLAERRGAALTRQVAETRTMNRFLLDFFNQADPSIDPDARNLRFVDVAARMVPDVRDAFADFPHVGADLLEILVQCLQRLGRIATAVEALNEARVLLEGDSSIDLAREVRLRLDAARLLIDLDDLASAQEHVSRVGTLLENQPDAPARVGHDLMQAILHVQTGRMEEATRLCDTAVAALENGPERSPRQGAQLHLRAAKVYAITGQLDRARAMMEQSLALDARVEHPSILHRAEAMQLRGILALRTRAFEEALELLGSSLETYESIHGRRHPRIAGLLHNLGMVHIERQELPEALRLMKEALEIFAAIYPASNPRIPRAHLLVGQLEQSLGRGDEARSHFERVLAIAGDHPGPQLAPLAAAARQALAR